MKLITLLGTRPEIIKLSMVIREMDCHANHILIHTGQNYDYELNEIFFKQLELRKPDYFLNVAAETIAQTIGNVIAKSDDVMEKEQPDALLLLGDTNSCLAAIAAKRRKIPIFHMEAGNRCFDQRVPEEINRKIVDHISDINMTYTEHARRYLLAEGIRPETVIKTGSPMKEVLTYHMPKILESDILSHLQVEPGAYFVVSVHREENVDNQANFNELMGSLQAIAQKYQKPIIVSTHPRTRKKLEHMGMLELDTRIRFFKPMGFLDYIKLQMNAFCTVSDSGTITEEASILNFPAVMIRQAHERPEGMDEGVLIMCGLKPESVIEAIRIVTAQHLMTGRAFTMVRDYDTECVSKKVLRIIMSYTDYINRTVWFR
ncbi:MAG: UDP-N-acetylglucosamine 2-epimerase (non-hydrolyzing) [Nitrospirota bacterium]